MNRASVFKCLNTQSCYLLAWLLFFIGNAFPTAAQPKKELPPISQQGNHLVYSYDERKNRVPDFSYCGYKASEESIPDVPVKVVVPVKNGDATLRIQSAINYVASLPADKNGFRGTVLLQ